MSHNIQNFSCPIMYLMGLFYVFKKNASTAFVYYCFPRFCPIIFF